MVIFEALEIQLNKAYIKCSYCMVLERGSIFSLPLEYSGLLSKLSSVVLFPCMFYRKGSFNPGEHTTSFAGSREIALKDSVLEDATQTVFLVFAGIVADWIY